MDWGIEKKSKIGIQNNGNYQAKPQRNCTKLEMIHEKILIFVVEKQHWTFVSLSSWKKREKHRPENVLEKIMAEIF